MIENGGHGHRQRLRQHTNRRDQALESAECAEMLGHGDDHRRLLLHGRVEHGPAGFQVHYVKRPDGIAVAFGSGQQLAHWH